MSTDRESFLAALQEAIAPWNPELVNEQFDRMADHYAAMVEANKLFNLTRITNPAEAAVKHYADSLALVAWAVAEKIRVRTMLDIGTGAGFPSVPVAIARPDWRVTAIDGTRKKVDFVARAAAELDLGNLSVIHAHTDHWDTDRRFDVVTARALGSIEKCHVAARPFAVKGGRIALFRTWDEVEGEATDRPAAPTRRSNAPKSRFRYQFSLAGESLQRVIAAYSR